LKRSFISYERFLKIQHFIIVFVDVSATAAAFVGTAVHQVLLQRTVSSHRCVEVGRSFWGTATGTPTESYTMWRKGLHTKHQKIRSNRAKQVSSHRPCHLFEPRHRMGPRQGDRQRKQQNGPVDQGIYKHQERTRQVDEARRGVLPTSTHLRLLTVSATTPGGRSFRWKQQQLPRRQQKQLHWIWAIFHNLLVRPKAIACGADLCFTP